MSNDPITAGAIRRGKELDVQWRKTEALLAEYENDGNEWGVSEAVSQLASIRTEATALAQLHAEHVQRNSYQPPAQSPEEWRVKSAEKMDGNDGLAVVNYGKKPGDPTWISNEEYNRQVAVLRQKKANGEYQR
jgi:hypothetical protein